jgi:2C-methyl-D-erythritol 2,4-cyclodiphosphate synthase
MNLTKGKIQKIFNKKNQTYKKLNCKKVLKKNITSCFRKKNSNLHNSTFSTFSTFKKSGAKPTFEKS